MTPLQLKKTVATLLGVQVYEIAEVVPVAWRVTTKKYEPGTTHVRQTETHRVEIA